MILLRMPHHHHLNPAADSARDAFDTWRDTPPHARAAVLDAIADALAHHRDLIISTCADETALTPAELNPEFDRTTGTLRMFAALTREGSWVRAAIDTRHADPRSSSDSPPLIGPDHDLRRILLPLGPVAVFGASNFPLAYGVLGGDTASALAAGCTVLIKEHPAHPRTGRLIAALAQRAITDSRGPEHLLSYIHHDNPADLSIAEQLVKHHAIRAVGFTGSTRAGFAIINLSHQRQGPHGFPDIIPVFAEMGSCNTLIVLRDAARNRLSEVVEQVALSLLARHGQQCTAPGVVLVAGHDNAHRFYDALAARLADSPARRLLAPNIAQSFYLGLERALATGEIETHTRLPTPDERAEHRSPPVLLYTQAVKMEDEPVLWQEIFGPALIVAGCDNLAHGYFHIPDALTVTIIGGDDATIDDQHALLDEAHIGSRAEILDWVQSRAGRIIFSGVPTGVRVAHSMVHSGPFPACNRPDTTAVGPLAIERWCRPVCFQNAPQHLLPEELRDANPRNILRTINGHPTRDAIKP
jgi:NADP-dependent aldehyde dehydrogenase